MLYDTLVQLAAVPLPPHALRTACRLLVQVDAYGGCTLTRPTLHDLCGGGPGTLRRHLNALAAAGVLIWRGHDDVTVTFAGYPERPGTPVATQQARSLALLTDPDVGLMPQTAATLAATVPFATLLRHTLAWRRDLATGRVRTPGALIERIRSDFSVTLTPADRHTGLWERHTAGLDPDDLATLGLADSEDERRRAYIPSEYADIILG